MFEATGEPSEFVIVFRGEYRRTFIQHGCGCGKSYKNLTAALDAAKKLDENLEPIVVEIPPAGRIGQVIRVFAKSA